MKRNTLAARIGFILVFHFHLFFYLTSAAQAQFVEHPGYTNWNRFPVGTSVTLRSQSVGKSDKTIETTTVMKLVRKTDKEVVISRQITTNATGETIKNEPFESSIKKNFPLFPGVDKTKIGRPQGTGEGGNESIEIMGKKYNAEWYVTKGTTEAGPSTTKTWISPDFPGQVLKSITEVPAGPNTTTEEVVHIEIPDLK